MNDNNYPTGDDDDVTDTAAATTAAANEESNGTNDDTNDSPSSTMYEQFVLAIEQIESESRNQNKTSISNVISTLLNIQEFVTRQSYFSTSSSSSETIDDISTYTLPYLTLDYHFAMAYLQLPIDVDQISKTRYTHLMTATTHFNAFFHTLEAYDLLTNDEKGQFETLIELTDHIHSTHSNNSCVDDVAGSSSLQQQQLRPLPPMNRDAKIAQYRQKQQLQQEQEKLKSLQLRRRRLQATISDDEIIDGYDQESLVRTINITAIHLAKIIALEEWSMIVQELPMIVMMIQQQQQQQRKKSGPDDRYHHKQHDTRQPQKPMELTQITKDSMTGQLRIHRQEIQKQTFRPGWNQPTMTLQELAEREVQGAIQRQQQQERSEANQKTQPRRYEQLVKDGMEDDDDLVEASAILDRKWDTFKDDNPRGCGNKRGDVGDRNF